MDDLPASASTQLVNNPDADPWLHAWHDPVGGIKAWSACSQLVDLNGDGDCKFIVADMEKNLKVYK